MDNKITELSTYRLSKAKEDLEASETLLHTGHFSQSLNRSYYAMFHATRALLAFERFDSKRHSGILAFFNQHYIKNGKIELKYYSMLTLAQKLRNNSDYDDFFVVSRDDAEQQLINAKEFIDVIDSFISRL